MAESKSTEWTSLRHTHLLWHDLPSGSWSHLELLLDGLFAKFTLSWPIIRLRSRWTSTWNSHKEFWLLTDLQGSCVEVREEHLRKEASRLRMELILLGQAHVHRIHTFPHWWLCFFHDDIIFMVFMDNGIFPGNDDSKLQDAIRNIQDVGRRSRSPSWLRWCQHQESKTWFLWVHPMLLNQFYHWRSWT